MARIESRHRRARLTVAGTVYDLAFPVEIGDGEGQAPEPVAEKLLSLPDYWRVDDAPRQLNTNGQPSKPSQPPAGEPGEGGDEGEEEQVGDDQAPAGEQPAPRARGRKRKA